MFADPEEDDQPQVRPYACDHPPSRAQAGALLGGASRSGASLRIQGGAEDADEDDDQLLMEAAKLPRGRRR